VVLARFARNRRPPPGGRRHPPPSPAGSGQPPGRHPARLSCQPDPLRRAHRLGHHQVQRRLTT
jgi:hypothetical protein